MNFPYPPLVITGLSLGLSGCFGPPSMTEYYEETLGPKTVGCLNKHYAVVSEKDCEPYRVGDAVFALMPRGSKEYYQDPEKPPYIFPALVCKLPRDSDIQLKKSIRLERFVVSSSSGKVFSDFNWGISAYNQHCKYLSLLPRLDITVDEDTEITIEMQVTLLHPEPVSKEMTFIFKGDSSWHLPFYGP